MCIIKYGKNQVKSVALAEIIYTVKTGVPPASGAPRIDRG
jgi:hypothetical protein